MKFIMYLKVISDDKEANLMKQTDLPFIPPVGMSFHYIPKALKVKMVVYSELSGIFFLYFEDIEIEVSRFHEMISDLKRLNWTIEEQWKRK